MIIISFFYFFVFLFGLVVGSFLNCVIYRLEKGASFLTGRSYCPHCKHILRGSDLIPIFSFVILRGKCRYCQKPISLQYPLVELATGVLFALVLNYELRITNFELFNFYNILNSLFLILISCLLVIIFIYDLRHYLIPGKVIHPAIIISGIWYFASTIFFAAYTKYQILNTIYSAVGAAAFFFLIILISRGRWLGLGDVELAFFMGLFLGWPNIMVALFLAFLLGAIIGLGLIILKKKTLKSEVPFGPFLVTGTFLALFWGKTILDFYLGLVIR